MATYWKRNTNPTNANWSTANNWSTVSSTSSTNTGTYPQAGDTAYFDADSINITINAASACAVLDCSNYANTITFSTFSLTLTSTLTLSSGMSFSAGTTGAIILGGAITITPNSCTSIVNVTSQAYTHTLSGSDFYTRILTLTGNAVFNKTGSENLNVGHNLTMSTYSLTGTAGLVISNTSTWSGSSTTGVTMPLTIDASGKTITVSSTVYTSGSLTIANGTVSGGTIAINGATTLTKTGGTLSSALTLSAVTYTLGSDFTTSSACTLAVSPTIDGGGTTRTFTLGSLSVGAYTITLQNSGNFAVAGSTTRTGNLVVNGSGLLFSTAGLTGNFTLTGTANVKLTGGTWSGTGTTGIANANLEIAGGTITISGTTYFTGTSFTVSAGTLTGTSTPVLFLSNNMTLTHSGGTIQTTAITLGAYTYTLASTFTSSGLCTIGGNATFSANYAVQFGTYTIGAYTHTLSSNWTITGNTTITNSSAAFSGAYTLTAGTLILGAAYSLPSAQLVIGGLSLGAYTLTLTDNVTATGTFTVTGNATLSGAYTLSSAGLSGSSTFTLASTNSTVKLTGGTWSWGTGNITTNISFDGDVTLSGTLPFLTRTITYVSGTITQGTSTLNIKGSCAITTPATNMKWYNITVNTATSDITLGGALELTGTLTCTTTARFYGGYGVTAPTCLFNGASSISVVLSADWTVGNVTVTTSTCALDADGGAGYYFIITGDFTQTGVSVSGSAGKKFTPPEGTTKTWSCSTNNIFLGGAVRFEGPGTTRFGTNVGSTSTTVFTYVGGTIDAQTNNSTLNVYGTTTFNTPPADMTFCNIRQYFSGGGLSLSSDLEATGTLTIAANSSIGGTGKKLYCNGLSGSSTFTLTAGGTSDIYITGGTWSWGTGNITINIYLDGDVTLSGTIPFLTKTITYVSGAINQGTSVLNIKGNCTLDTNGMSWYSITISATTTLTLSSNLSATGTLTLRAALTTAGAGTLTVGAIANQTSGYTHTLGQNWYCTGETTITQATTLNGNNLYTGGLQITALNKYITGTTNIIMNGTGTLSTGISAYIQNNLTINTTGTVTFGDIIVLGNFMTFTYTAGTIDANTNSSIIYFVRGSGVTFAGWTIDVPFYNFYLQYGDDMIITAGTNVAISNEFQALGQPTSAATRCTITSATPSSDAFLTLLSSASQMVQWTNATDINSSLGKTVWVFGNTNTLTRTTNWNQFTELVTTAYTWG